MALPQPIEPPPLPAGPITDEQSRQGKAAVQRVIQANDWRLRTLEIKLRRQGQIL